MRRAARIALTAAIGLAGARAAPPVDAAAAAIRAQAQVAPSPARVGQRVSYRGRVIYPAGATGVRWLPPEPGGDLTWGTVAARRVRGAGSDTLEARVTVQAFRTGTLVVPGLRFQLSEGGAVRVARLPAVRLEVTSVLAGAGANPALRPLRGPLAAPWWERVPWGALLLVGLGVAVAAALLALWRRRRPRVAPAAEPALDPAAAALAELSALRRRNLAAQGRFAEHAFFLSRIARHFLEATAGSLCPGLSTPELVERYRGTTLDDQDAGRLEALLRAWDRIKFARASSSVGEATTAEMAVEERVRRWGSAPARSVG
jgi:hypothetical protein